MGITADRRPTAAKLMNAGKFAVHSAMSEVVLQVYSIVKGKLKKKNLVVVEEMQAKLEKLQQDMNKIQQQQSKISALRTEEKEHLRYCYGEPEQPLKSTAPEATGQRKIFIRSRL